MNNPHLHGYHTDYPICDSHLHIYTPVSLERSVQVFTDIMNFFNYDRLTLHPLCSLSSGIEPTRNLRALYCKDVINSTQPDKRVYVFGTLTHHPDRLETADGYLRQITELHRMGCDGIKMLEGKPGPHKAFGRRLDDPILDKFYAYAQEHQLMITMHLGDPPAFWDKSKMSDFEIKAGWFCDDSFPKLEELRKEVFAVLRKFPRLRINLAHFFFLSEELETCEKLMEEWPTVTFGLTPGDEMYAGFSQRPDEWRAFFEKYADRLHYGTDFDDLFYSENLEDYDQGMGSSCNLIRRMMETHEPFEHKHYGTLTPICPNEETLRKIYRDNFIAHIGAEPRALNRPLIAQAAAHLMSLYEHHFFPAFSEEKCAQDLAVLQQIYQHFLTE